MDLAAVGTYTAIGLTFGLTGGLSPGPITALVIGQTLRYGRHEGYKVALAPVITDGPLLALTMFLVARLQNIDVFAAVVGLLGAAVLFWLAVDSMKAGQLTVENNTGSPGSVTKAVLTNLVNPHPYLFWFTIGAPTALKAAQAHPGALVGFVSGFAAAIVGTKMLIAYSVDRYRTIFSGPAYRWTMRILGIMLMALGVQFAMDGIDILLR